MFLKNLSNGHVVEVLGLNDLVDPSKDELKGRYHWSEEIQEPEQFRIKRFNLPIWRKLTKMFARLSLSK